MVRVHRELLAAQRVPAGLVTPSLWKERFEDITAYERHLARSGHSSASSSCTSRKRAAEAVPGASRRPDKNWKFSAADVGERERWDEYMDAYKT